MSERLSTRLAGRSPSCITTSTSAPRNSSSKPIWHLYPLCPRVCSTGPTSEEGCKCTGPTPCSTLCHQWLRVHHQCNCFAEKLRLGKPPGHWGDGTSGLPWCTRQCTSRLLFPPTIYLLRLTQEPEPTINTSFSISLPPQPVTNIRVFFFFFFFPPNCPTIG